MQSTFIDNAVTHSQNTTTRFVRDFTTRLRHAHNSNDWNLARRIVEEVEGRIDEIAIEIATQAGVAMLLQGVFDKLEQLQAAVTRMESHMATKEDVARVQKSIDDAATEIGTAVEFIKNHSATQSDPQLQAMADKLDAAVAVLKGVDVEAVAVPADTGGGTTSAGTGA